MYYSLHKYYFINSLSLSLSHTHTHTMGLDLSSLSPFHFSLTRLEHNFFNSEKPTQLSLSLSLSLSLQISRWLWTDLVTVRFWS
ncbi:hypothetical protein I3842_14G069100 [Carya illinoinensis]|uniref:Uncharacterized protein n=1 Tax=Carya illinoinensis TaxID=32201 RepID=A0A922AG29_CARIL|nr:hypothetical protein I3842_14G069100 [Carya illinoinensis]